MYKASEHEEKVSETSLETVASGFLSCQWAEWFLSECWVFVLSWMPCLLCHWDCCLFKRLACQTESATDSQTLG